MLQHSGPYIGSLLCNFFHNGFSDFKNLPCTFYSKLAHFGASHIGNGSSDKTTDRRTDWTEYQTDSAAYRCTFAHGGQARHG